MRIAVLSSNFIRIPPEPEYVPKGFSGAPEKVMDVIAEAMVKKSHEVTLFATGDSKFSGKLVSVTEISSSLDPAIGKGILQVEYEHLLISKCYQMAKNNEFDIIHSIFDIRSSYYAPLVSTPTVATLHNPLTGTRKIILSKVKKNQLFISISNAQRKSLPDLNYISTIYHGVDKNSYPFLSTNKNDSPMIFVGRLFPDKGIITGISVAKRLQKPLYLLGTALEEKDYWKNEILPNIDSKIIYQRGFLNPKELISHYQNAKLFFFPIQWEEPFGLVMIEAMACGTPVVAYARGSVPEVLKDGETGFIVNSSEEDRRGDWIIKKTGIAGLCEAVNKIYSMPEEQYKQMRKNCRAHVEKNFTVERMVDQYEEIYKKILKINKQKS